MAALLIKSIPASLHRNLKKCATQHHRSMTQEALVLLEEGVERTLRSSKLGPVFKGRFPLTTRFLKKAKQRGRR